MDRGIRKRHMCSDSFMLMNSCLLRVYPTDVREGFCERTQREPIPLRQCLGPENNKIPEGSPKSELRGACPSHFSKNYMCLASYWQTQGNEPSSYIHSTCEWKFGILLGTNNRISRIVSEFRIVNLHRWSWRHSIVRGELWALTQCTNSLRMCPKSILGAFAPNIRFSTFRLPNIWFSFKSNVW